MPENVRPECQLGNHRRYGPEQDDRKVGGGLSMTDENERRAKPDQGGDNEETPTQSFGWLEILEQGYPTRNDLPP